MIKKIGWLLIINILIYSLKALINTNVAYSQDQ